MIYVIFRWIDCDRKNIYGVSAEPVDPEEAARDELLESGMADAAVVSADQRGRLMMSTERLNKSSDRVRDRRRTMLETDELGVSLLQDLHQQRQSLLHAHGTGFKIVAVAALKSFRLDNVAVAALKSFFQARQPCRNSFF
ncbi:hypothetical protein Hanom_Chr06g00550851 [Helianthus anomalus]